MKFEALKNALEKQTLFSGKTWKLSPDAWPLSQDETRTLHALARAVPAFYRALEKLYLASAENKKILRNGTLTAPWVAPILDRGKPPRLIAHQRSRALAGKLPPVLRPDLLICADGFALTELDSVPGGIGLTAFLSRLYDVRNNAPLENAADGGNDLDASPPETAFLRALSAAFPQKKPERGNAPRIAIAVSDEAASYRPEFEWLAQTLRSREGAAIFVCHPRELDVAPADGVFLRGEKIDVVYRFFELFDLGNVPCAEALFEATERGNACVLPPMRPFQEEKSALALLHHPVLEPFWAESLGGENFSLLKKIVPEAWLVEPAPKNGLPAGAVLLAPKKNALPIRSWEEFADAPRRDRDLVLKASGFDPAAWGARSVTVGRDASQAEWAAAVKNALSSAREKNSLYIAQRFRKPARLPHRVFTENGDAVPAEGRVRICPYYFAEKDPSSATAGTLRYALRYALCTFCPPDKKIIHGMTDATLVPVQFSPRPSREH